jgi:hypothetical protein
VIENSLKLSIQSDLVGVISFFEAKQINLENFQFDSCRSTSGDTTSQSIRYEIRLKQFSDDLAIK